MTLAFGVLVGVVDHPAFLEHIRAPPLGVLHRLDDPHQRNVVAHGRAARTDLDRHSRRRCLSDVLFGNVVVAQLLHADGQVVVFVAFLIDTIGRRVVV